MPTDVVMPQMGESVAEGTITKWFKQVGDRVERDEPLFEITTDKVDAEIPSPAQGVLSKILARESETVPVNTVVAVIDEVGAAVAAPGPPPTSTEKAKATAPTAAAPEISPQEMGLVSKTRTSPLVRRLAEEHRVDLSRIRGTGMGGRVTKKDILDFVATSSAAPGMAAVPTTQPVLPAPRTAPKISFTGPTEVVPMTPMRKQIAEHMIASRRISAHVATVFEVEMTRISETRARHETEFEQRHGFKLTYTPFFVRAVVEALRDFPVLNASVEGTNIVYKRDLNIGVAVALETGLLVPVIKRAQELNFLGLAHAVHGLAERARSKRLSVDDVQGGTFTITNPGIFGSLFGTPIINQPQVAILAVGAIDKRPVVRHDALAIRSMVYLTLSFDHRIVDGAVADQFMARVKSVLETWEEPVL